MSPALAGGFSTTVPPGKSYYLFLNLLSSGTSLAVWWLRFRTSNARGTGLIPGQGAEISHATWYSQKKILLFSTLLSNIILQTFLYVTRFLFTGLF